MLAMTEEEARALMHSHRWTYQERKRRSLGRKYIYARRKIRGKVVERYICPLSQLGELTEDELVEKLTTGPAENA